MDTEVVKRYPIKAYSKGDLARMYGVSAKTMAKWIASVPDNLLQTKCRLYTPRQVILIFKHIGEP